LIYYERWSIDNQSKDYDRLFDSTNKKEFTIEFEEDEFEMMISNMQSHFDLFGNYIDNTMYHVTMTYTDDFDHYQVLEVGFRTKSTTS